MTPTDVHGQWCACLRHHRCLQVFASCGAASASTGATAAVTNATITSPPNLFEPRAAALRASAPADEPTRRGVAEAPPSSRLPRAAPCTNSRMRASRYVRRLVDVSVTAADCLTHARVGHLLGSSRVPATFDASNATLATRRSSRQRIKAADPCLDGLADEDLRERLNDLPPPPSHRILPCALTTPPD